MKQLRGSGILSSGGKTIATVEYDLTLTDNDGIFIYRGILTGSPCSLLTAQGLGDASLILEDGTVVWLVVKSLKGDCAFVAGSIVD